MIDSYAIALKRRPNVAFEHSNVRANVYANAYANAHVNAVDDVIVHSDADAMSVETFATMVLNFVDVVRQQRPQHLTTPVDPNSCDSVLG